MKLQHIIQAVYFSPWNITREGWQAVHSVVKPHLLTPDGMKSLDLPRSGIDTDIFGEPLAKMEIRPDGVCIIPIMGTLMHHATLMDKQCGACSYDDVKANVREAMNTPGVNKIVLHVDSPGGMSMGSHECAKVIDDCAQFFRVEAVTDCQICSAAYDLVAGVAQIKCTSTSMVGSIGTLLPWMDQTIRYEMAGLKMELFTSGDLKGAGWPGTELSPEQRAHFQATVDKFAGMFKAHVTEHRPVEESAMRGQALVGSDAMEAGLVDEIVDDVEECFEPGWD